MKISTRWQRFAADVLELGVDAEQDEQPHHDVGDTVEREQIATRAQAAIGIEQKLCAEGVDELDAAEVEYHSTGEALRAAQCVSERCSRRKVQLAAHHHPRSTLLCGD